MAKKKRINLTVDEELHRRSRKLLDQLPGATFSGLVEEALEGLLPTLEALVEVKGQAQEAQEAALANLLAEQLIGLANDGVQTMRIAKKVAGDR